VHFRDTLRVSVDVDIRLEDSADTSSLIQAKGCALSCRWHVPRLDFREIASLSTLRLFYPLTRCSTFFIIRVYMSLLKDSRSRLSRDASCSKGCCGSPNCYFLSSLRSCFKLQLTELGSKVTCKWTRMMVKDHLTTVGKSANNVASWSMMGDQRDSVDLLEALSSWKKTQSYDIHPYRYGRTYHHQADADWKIGKWHPEPRFLIRVHS
jgi:hypothetical protein